MNVRLRRPKRKFYISPDQGRNAFLIRRLLDKLGTTLYVQIWKNRLRIVDTRSGAIFDEKPLLAVKIDAKGQKKVIAFGNEAEIYANSSDVSVLNPFDHVRQLLADFVVAERLLQGAVQKVLGKNLISASPLICIHPMETIEGGLTYVEMRAFRELCISAGARDVKVYTGPELTPRTFQWESIREPVPDQSSPGIPVGRTPNRVLIPIIVWLTIFGLWLLYNQL